MPFNKIYASASTFQIFKTFAKHFLFFIQDPLNLNRLVSFEIIKAVIATLACFEIDLFLVGIAF